MKSEISLVLTIVSISVDFELDSNYLSASTTRSDSNVTVVDHAYTKKIFRNNIKRYNSSPRLGGS